VNAGEQRLVALTLGRRRNRVAERPDVPFRFLNVLRHCAISASS
jgi:hypothetical protein